MKASIVLAACSGVITALFLPACNEHQASPSRENIGQMNLKTGELISCGVGDAQFGEVNFQSGCAATVKEDFNLAMELLHSFEYDEAEKVFARIIDIQPDCAMAYWGVAMSNFHPLWTPPTEAELQKGAKAIALARECPGKSERISAYINAIAAYYDDWDKKDHASRCKLFENAMAAVYASNPADVEAALFYALALDASAAPTDKTFTNQKKAAGLLNALYPAHPTHPGILHYLIHTYDYPGLAVQALPAARKYATVAPSSAHALHMPSHIFTRLGLWEEAIRSNKISVDAAKCYAEAAAIKGHWDEELHGLDYLVYAYLQKGDADSARMHLNYLQTITEVYPANFKVAYAFAAIPSRVALESKDWDAAATVNLYPATFPWDNFPWQEAMIHFTRAMGAIQTGRKGDAEKELSTLEQLREKLAAQKDIYKTKQVDIQMKTVQAWLQHKQGNHSAALKLMSDAAAMEDSTGKHPVTPGELIPARELLGDLLMLTGNYKDALIAYEANLEKNPNRLNGLLGAGMAAKKSGDAEKAVYYQKLLEGRNNSSASMQARL